MLIQMYAFPHFLIIADLFYMTAVSVRNLHRLVPIEHIMFLALLNSSTALEDTRFSQPIPVIPCAVYLLSLSKEPYVPRQVSNLRH